jgi:hypothetical protein
MPDHPVARSALPLALGFLSLGLGWFTAWLWPDGRVVPTMLFMFGLIAAPVGVYRLADVVDRAARALIEAGTRRSQT